MRLYLSLVVSGNTSHVVMDSGKDGDGLPSYIYSSKDHCSLRNARQTGGQLLRGQMVQLQVYVVFFRSTATENETY